MIAVPTLHPAFILRSKDGDKGDAKFRDTVIKDLGRAAALRFRKRRYQEDDIWLMRAGADYPFPLFPTVADVLLFCDLAERTPGILSIDVEATGEQPMQSRLICVGMGFYKDPAAGDPRKIGPDALYLEAPVIAICVPLLRQGDLPYWTEEEARTVHQALRRLMASKKPKVFQNGGYDTVVLARHGMPVSAWEHDTMQAHHVADGEMPHGLDYLVSVYTESPYYKDAVKGDERWVNKDDLTLRVYNLRDVIGTLRSLVPMLKFLHEWKLFDLYQQEVEQAQWMALATWRGVAVDIHRRDDTSPETDPKECAKQLAKYGFVLPKGLGPKLRVQRDHALSKLQAYAGDPAFNPNSHPQLLDFLFDRLRFPVVKKTAKGAPCTDKEAMVLLGLHAETEEQQGALLELLRFRRTGKLLGTFVEGLKLAGDGRVHPSWKILPVTGRFASSPNVQNLNKAVKRIFRAGWVHPPCPRCFKGDYCGKCESLEFVSVDLSQAELRGIAYLANDLILLDYYRRGLNVHSLNTALLFQVRSPTSPEKPFGLDMNEATFRAAFDEVKERLGLDYEGLPVAPEKKWKKMRRLAKNFVFGDDYGALADTLFQNIRKERDDDDELIFADLKLGDIEGLKAVWESVHAAIPVWWTRIMNHVHMRGHYRSPLSGRIRWFRGGLKKTEILNFPIQEIVAAHMLRMNRICRDVYDMSGGETLLTLQVHDALTFEGPKRYSREAGRIMKAILDEPFHLPPVFDDYPAFSDATFPADDPTYGTFYDEI